LLGLSHEQLEELKRIANDAKHGQAGRSRSTLDNALALRHMSSHQQLGHSFDVSVKAVAAADIASPNTIRAAHRQFLATGTLPTPTPRSNPAHPFFSDTGPSLQAEITIHRHLQAVKLDNTYESLNTLKDALAAESIHVSKSTLHRWVHSMGYRYGKKHFTTTTASYRNSLIRNYIYKYADALKQQEDGDAVIVYMDESYVYSHHCTASFWHHVSNSSTSNDVRGDNKGKRLIIMHAMTKDGMLEVNGVEPSNILTELYHSCALIFNEVCVDDITPADYHDTINGEKFIGWIQQRLLPTFKKVHLDKKMVLVLDNAKYHHHRGPDWFSPSTKKKGQLADFLRQRDVPSITTDDGRVIPASKFSADARRGGVNGGPTLAELRAAVKQHLLEHPDINTTVPQQLMDDAGYELLYTPPYISQLQPIELIWAFTKALVARQSHRSRTVDQAAAQTRSAMDKVTAELCQSVIDHCHAWINQFIRSDDADSLSEFKDLAALMQADLKNIEIDNTSTTDDQE
jgi:transposase